ncbi:MAG: GyrI-like domain-containing protein [Actinomycetota bacterium]
MGEIEIINLKPQLVIGIRKKGYYKDIAELLPKLYEYASKKGAEFSGMPSFICRESAEEAEEANKTGNADIEVVAPIKNRIEENDEMHCYTLPGGKMAKAIHKGPYEACEATYNELFEWIKKNNKKIIGPIRESYLNDPREVGPEEILTEIYVPID